MIISCLFPWTPSFMRSGTGSLCLPIFSWCPASDKCSINISGCYELNVCVPSKSKSPWNLGVELWGGN